MKRKSCFILLTAVLLMMLSVIPVSAKTTVTVPGVVINEANFPDANFRAVVSGVDQDGNGGDPGGLIGFAASALAAVFLWNVFVQQLTVTSFK